MLDSKNQFEKKTIVSMMSEENDEENTNCIKYKLRLPFFVLFFRYMVRLRRHVSSRISRAIVLCRLCARARARKCDDERGERGRLIAVDKVDPKTCRKK